MPIENIGWRREWLRVEELVLNRVGNQLTNSGGKEIQDGYFFNFSILFIRHFQHKHLHYKTIQTVSVQLFEDMDIIPGVPVF